MTKHGSEESRRRDGRIVALSAAAVAILVLLLLHPASGIDRQPPECYSSLGYVVPCGAGLAVGSALVGAVVTVASVYAVKRRRQP